MNFCHRRFAHFLKNPPKAILFICSLSCLLILSGCGLSDTTKISGTDQPHIPSPGSENTQFQSNSSAGQTKETTLPVAESLLQAPDFNTFSTDLFRSLAAEDSLSLHYTLLHPETFQISAPPVSFGTFSRTSLKESAQQAELLLSALHRFSADTLSEEDRFLFELLDNSLQTSLLSKDLELYTSPLGPTTGLQTQLPVLLAEYRFSSISDVENYFQLLSDLPRFFEDLSSFEQARTAAGLGFCSQVLTMICDQCREFIRQPDQNLLIAGFSDRLNTLPELSAQERAKLCLHNQNLVFTKVIPAYEHLISALGGLSDAALPPQGLCALPNGKLCYAALVRQKTGSDKSVEEIITLLENALFENLLTMVNLQENASLQTELEHYLSCGPTAEPADASLEGCSRILAKLKEKILTDFPAPAAADCHVSLIHPSLADYISPALYLVPPLDGYTDNVIYLNTAKCKTANLFSTLAHEGYPGHLYQNTFFAAKNPHPLRMLLNYTGYDEGWATYAELFSYRYTDCSEALQQFLAAEQIAGLCLYSLSDIKIHYLGESKEDILCFLKDYGLTAADAEEVYFTQLSEPGIYLPYSIGCLEFLELQKEYLDKAGASAPLLDFHTFLLECGPAPFSLLHKKLEERFR